MISRYPPKEIEEEGNALAKQWLESGSKLEIMDYILTHCSEAFKRDYIMRKAYIDDLPEDGYDGEGNYVIYD
ncbi:MAG: hypothetical protein RSC99_10050 [Clostridiales bacterium]